MRLTYSRPDKHLTKDKFIAVVLSLPLRSGGHLTFTGRSTYVHLPTRMRLLSSANCIG